VADANIIPGVVFSTTTAEERSASTRAPGITTCVALPVYAPGSNTKDRVSVPTLTVASSRTPSWFSCWR
jgi:hypothetical protein